MAAIQNFRSAIGGFNREDVVRYIEYMNNKHNAELEQLRSQLQTAQEELAKADNTELLAKLEAAEARCAELEAQKVHEAPVPTPQDSELETYRRAERAERLARERASQIYAQANAALADVTVKVEAISDNIGNLYQQFDAKMQAGKKQLQDAVASLYAIRPEEE